MINSHPDIYRWIVITLLVIILAACLDTPLTPSQTVQHFWTALLSENPEEAGKYATRDSIPELSNIQTDFVDTSVSFGKIRLETSRALIETTLKQSIAAQGDQPEVTLFQTVLDKEDKLWKVNFIETRKLINDAKQKKGLSKLVDDLQGLGRDITGRLGGVLKNWEKVTPEIKKEMEQLGDTVQKQLQESIDKHGPELQEKLNEFTESLDDALKDLEKSLPPKDRENNEVDPKARMI